MIKLSDKVKEKVLDLDGYYIDESLSRQDISLCKKLYKNTMPSAFIKVSLPVSHKGSCESLSVIPNVFINSVDVSDNFTKEELIKFVDFPKVIEEKENAKREEELKVLLKEYEINL